MTATGRDKPSTQFSSYFTSTGMFSALAQPRSRRLASAQCLCATPARQGSERRVRLDVVGLLQLSALVRVLRQDHRAFLVGVVLRRGDLHAVGDDRLEDLLEYREDRHLQIRVDPHQHLLIPLLGRRLVCSMNVSVPKSPFYRS